MGKIEQCILFAFSAIGGDEGFFNELIAITFFILIFIFFTKWVLKKLSARFKKNKQYWHESFVNALFLPLIYYAWFFIGLHIVDLIGQHFCSKTIFADRNLWLKIGAIFALMWFFLRWKRSLIMILNRKSKNHEINMAPAKLDVINKAATIGFLFIAFFMLLDVTNSSLTTLIAFGGIGGLALAFASQEIIANFFSGGMVYLTQPFLVDDHIILPEKNIEGHVEDIGWYMTSVRTLDKRPVYIPNSIFSKIVVVNPSRITYHQFKETFSIRYEDISKIKPIIADITQMLRADLRVDNNQRIAAYLATFTTYSLDIVTLSFIEAFPSLAQYFEYKQEILLKIFEIIEKHGAKLAVPITYFERKKP